MKRDMDLVREILLEAEAHDPDGTIPELELDEWSPEMVFEHVLLLRNAGFVEAALSQETSCIHRITWEGYELLDSIRDATVWAKVKRSLGKVGGSASLEVVKALAIAATKEQLGLQVG